MVTTSHTSACHSDTIWLSGETLTLINKLVFPTIWLAVFAGIVLSVFVHTEHPRITNAFPVLVALVIATGFVLWMSSRLERVGYAGVELVVANYWREARVPFEEIEAVEPGWLYPTRVVRIRFRKQASFGHVIYYLSRRSFAKCDGTTSAEELRDLLMQAGVTT